MSLRNASACLGNIHLETLVVVELNRVSEELNNVENKRETKMRLKLSITL
jgi:hypothetical protein